MYFLAYGFGTAKIQGADTPSFHSFSQNGSFAADKNHVYLEVAPITGVDATTFTFLSKNYAKDKNSVYSISDQTDWSGRNIYSVQLKKLARDLQSFIVFDDSYTADKDSVYYNNTPMTGVDRITFSALGFGYAKDKNHVYYDGKIKPNADAASFGLIVAKDKAGRSVAFYTKDKNGVYDYDKGLIANSDPTTFVILDTYDNYYYYDIYAKDKHFVYFDGTPIQNSDPSTFTILGDGLARDKNGVYFGADVSSIDPSSFEQLSYNDAFGYGYYKDKKAIYFGEQKITGFNANNFSLLPALSKIYYPFFKYYTATSSDVYGGTCHGELKLLRGIDGNTAVALDSFYLKDKNGVYVSNHDNACGTFNVSKLSADANTFAVLIGNDGQANTQYAKDKNSVFYQGKVIEGADPGSFQILSGYGVVVADYNSYAKDKNHLYYQGAIFSGVDPSTFTRIGSTNFMKTQNAVYANTDTIIPGADPQSFVVIANGLNDGYAKDSYSVWHFAVLGSGPKKIPGADPATFVVLDDLYSKDKNNVYKSGEIVSGADPNTFAISYDVNTSEFDPHDQYEHYDAFTLYRGE